MHIHSLTHRFVRGKGLISANMETKNEFELGVLTPTPISVIHPNCRWFLLVGTLTNVNTCWDTDNILVTVIIGYRGADLKILFFC